MMKRRMMSWLMVLAMLCTLVPTAFAASSNDIEIDADVDSDDTYYFDEVYDAIAEELKYDWKSETYYVKFTDDDDESDLCDDEDEIVDEDYDYRYIDLDYVEYLYLDVDPDDDQWEGSYTVYDEDDDKVLSGDIIIYFDGRSGDYDVELTWAYEDDYYFDDDDTEEGVSVYEAIDDILDDELTDKEWDTIDWDLVVYDFTADRNSDDVADLEQDKDDEWYLSINDTGTWTGTWTIATLPADAPSGKQETRAVIPAIFAPDFPFPFCFIISQNYTVSQPVNQLFQQIFSTFFAKISSENVFEGINSPIKHSFKQVRSRLHCCRPALRANFVVFIRFSEGSL